jgi:DNA-binding response OmpR family regulator
MESMSQSPVRLLIVENDERLSTSLLDHFRPKYTATTAGDTDTALGYLSQPPGYDVTLLDLSLPNTEGCNLLEQANKLPIETSFLVMSDPEGLNDRIQGSTPNIDDYIVKPFAMEELNARVETILCQQLAPGSYGSDVYATDDLTINFAARSCFRDGERIPLTSREFQILQYLVEQRGHVVSREELRQEVWEDDDAILLRTVDRHVAEIRKKIEQTPNAPAYLHTVHGKGYEFACAEYA